MIFHPRFVFVHVPRTAGSSMFDALGGFTAENSVYSWRMTGRARHLPLSRIDRKERFIFGFVRNPWERLVSLYRHFCELGAVDVVFKQWLMCGRDHLREDPRGALPLQRRPQLWWLDGCDYIGRFESLHDDFAHALCLAGVEPRPLPLINKTGGGEWRAEYHGEARGFVADHHAQDIERFGYSFDDERQNARAA